MNRIMIKRLFLLCLMMFPICLCAQKKEISQARGYIKARTDLSKAEELMRGLLKDSANLRNEKVWLTLFEAVKAQYDKGNEELYLKNKYDTAALFISARKMFSVLEGFDSIEAQPDRKGQVRLKYRNKHAEYLDSYRRNIYNGGLFFVSKQDFSQAYSMFDTYIDCQNQPLFSSYNYAEKDELIPHAAYLALYCGFKLADEKKILKYEELAKKDTAKLDNTLQYLSLTYLAMKDTASYESVLNTGFAKYPCNTFYFSHLFDLYYSQGDMEKSLELCDLALAADSSKTIVKFAESSVLLNMERYDECIRLCDEVIAADGNFADAYLNAGLAYFYQAGKINKNTVEARKNKSRIRELYKRSMPYMQRYKELKPQDKDKWGLPLYTIYLNLNMGNEFDEIDAILNGKSDGTE